MQDNHPVLLSLDAALRSFRRTVEAAEENGGVASGVPPPAAALAVAERPYT